MSIGDIVIEPARPGDDAALRRILRLSPLPGWVSLSHECEPSLAGALRATGAKADIIVARDKRNGRVAGFFSRQSRKVFLDGQERELGYMGQLRFDPSCRYRLSILRAGFAYWREHLHGRAQLPWDITSMLADNLAARRLLEAGKRGFPRYAPLCGYTTLALAARKGGRTKADGAITSGREEDLCAIRRFIRDIYREYQLAPSLPEREWRAILTLGGLKAEDFLVCREGGEMSGVLAVWDQGAHKQAVVRAYAPLVRIVRPFVNPFLPPLGLPALPAPGQPLRQATLSFTAIRPDRQADILPRLIRAAQAMAARRGLDVLLTGWAAGNPMTEILRKHFRCLEYKSNLYLVRPATADDAAGAARIEALRASRMHQELCFL